MGARWKKKKVRDCREGAPTQKPGAKSEGNLAGRGGLCWWQERLTKGRAASNKHSAASPRSQEF